MRMIDPAGAWKRIFATAVHRALLCLIAEYFRLFYTRYWCNRIVIENTGLADDKEQNLLAYYPVKIIPCLQKRWGKKYGYI